MGEIFVTAMTNMFPQTGHFALAVGGSSNFFEYAVSISPRLFEGLKMTITRPFLLMILHFSHMGFTDGLTFIVIAPSLFRSPNDSALCQVIRRHFH